MCKSIKYWNKCVCKASLTVGTSVDHFLDSLHVFNKAVFLPPNVCCRFDSEWLDREVFRVADTAQGGASGQGRSSAAVGQGSEGDTNAAFRSRHVPASLVQHLPSTFSCYVYLRHFRHVFLHERQGEERARWCLQLQDVSQVHDSSLPGEFSRSVQTKSFESDFNLNEFAQFSYYRNYQYTSKTISL